MSFLVGADLIYILFNNGIEVDLQGVEYNPRSIGHYYLKDTKHLPKFLKFLELHLLQTDSILEYYSRGNTPYNTYKKVTTLLLFIGKFKDKLMNNNIQENLKLR
ncbi:hypothetical protein [Helicobacter mastomyrinus]|uniref:Uncharacterized protein n=1 Tax=Helicobacter mastomyrinus TaxID=287948 RepID=A0ABZ3F841_9HELI|nr:hypothetical protein [uncultured Helicobacter sp.]